jgi:para-aminobenzoate synthetase component 1
MNFPDALFYLRYPREDCDSLLAEGIEDSFMVHAGDKINWDELDEWVRSKSDWIFGWVGYDVRTCIEQLGEESLRSSSFPKLVLFRPRNLFKLKGSRHEVLKGMWHDALDCWRDTSSVHSTDPIQLDPQVDFLRYFGCVSSLKNEIAAGNVYELNYCIPFESSASLNDPIGTWKNIYAKTEAPFSAFARLGHFHVMCASPERYLKRFGNQVISQPIKGTIKRGDTPQEDELLKNQLQRSRKERAENVMIVDLVRNDLSRVALRNSVQVDELFELKTFKTLHHLVSTVRCEVSSQTTWVDLIRATFPMGSMTGAPKVSAMKLISAHEESERGIYSGSIGYIEPSGDFDFNVVIRGLQYDGEQQTISCHVGSAITALCDAESEYRECLLKAEAILNALRG